MRPRTEMALSTLAFYGVCALSIATIVTTVTCGTGTYVKSSDIHKPLQTIATIVWKDDGCDVLISLTDGGMMRYHESKDSDNCNKLSFSIPVAASSMFPEKEAK